MPMMVFWLLTPSERESRYKRFGETYSNPALKMEAVLSSETFVRYVSTYKSNPFRWYSSYRACHWTQGSRVQTRQVRMDF
jgi:hypothetical protein